ncbi:MAG: hypothetical protein JWO45_2050, partial [Spartobacteria bacterium]|nr:hypothetical protein [Spartobacteria bacterium]
NRDLRDTPFSRKNVCFRPIEMEKVWFCFNKARQLYARDTGGFFGAIPAELAGTDQASVLKIKACHRS